MRKTLMTSKILRDTLLLRGILYSNNSDELISCICSSRNLAGKMSEVFSISEIVETYANLFTMLWLDETLYFVLNDKNNPECLNNDNLYDEIRAKFPFPKFGSHGARGLGEPSAFLSFILNDKEYLLFDYPKIMLKAKKTYWEIGVKDYLIQNGGEDIVPVIEEELINDLKIRYRYTEEQEIELKALWS